MILDTHWRHHTWISWRCKKQQIVALSSCEAEYVALTHTLQEAKFLRQLFSDMMMKEKQCVTIYADNRSAIDLSKNPIFHQRSKHIDIKYHFIRSEISNNTVNVIHVPSDKNFADMFTKPLSKFKLQSFNSIFG